MGLAGTIVGRLAIATTLHQRVPTEEIAVLARELIHRAERTAETLSWPSPIFQTRVNLAGLSHGAAGVAFALLEAADATSDAELRDAALLAFAYEQGLYDDRVRNWRDVRFERPDGNSRSFVTFWCHGAPGIAVSRLRALASLDDERVKQQGQVALATTLDSIADGSVASLANYSLCHGLFGNAEIVLGGLADASPDASAKVRSLVLAAADRHGPDPAAWPTALAPHFNPGLFLGLAGIGYFYLRLVTPTLPSVLEPRFAATNRA